MLGSSRGGGFGASSEDLVPDLTNFYNQLLGLKEVCGPGKAPRVTDNYWALQ